MIPLVEVGCNEYLDPFLFGFVEQLTILQLWVSGGPQKGAYFFGRPCVAFRDDTEWTELVEAGWNRVVGADTARILEALSASEKGAAGASRQAALYGRGDAADRNSALLVQSAPR